MWAFTMFRAFGRFFPAPQGKQEAARRDFSAERTYAKRKAGKLVKRLSLWQFMGRKAKEKTEGL